KNRNRADDSSIRLLPRQQGATRERTFYRNVQTNRPMPKFVIGIDLGTTNCGLAYAEAEALDPHQAPSVALFPIPQLVNPSEVREEPLLPSFLYVPGPADFPAGSTALPWNEK